MRSAHNLLSPSELDDWHSTNHRCQNEPFGRKTFCNAVP